MFGLGGWRSSVAGRRPFLSAQGRLIAIIVFVAGVPLAAVLGVGHCAEEALYFGAGMITVGALLGWLWDRRRGPGARAAHRKKERCEE